MNNMCTLVLIAQVVFPFERGQTVTDAIDHCIHAPATYGVGDSSDFLGKMHTPLTACTRRSAKASIAVQLLLLLLLMLMMSQCAMSLYFAVVELFEANALTFTMRRLKTTNALRLLSMLVCLLSQGARI